MSLLLDLSVFANSDPQVFNKDLSKVRFSDLTYTNRLAALLAATRDKNNPIYQRDVFNDLLNGRHSVQAVNDALIKITQEKPHV